MSQESSAIQFKNKISSLVDGDTTLTFKEIL